MQTMFITVPQKEDVGQYNVVVEAALLETGETVDVAFTVTVKGCTPDNFVLEPIDDIELTFGTQEVTIEVPLSQAPCDDFYTLTQSAVLQTG